MCSHRGGLGSYVTHLATCFREQDTAAVCGDAKRRAAHLHLFSTQHIHIQTHAKFMAFNGPELSLASGKCRKVSQDAGRRRPLALYFQATETRDRIWSCFNVACPFFLRGKNGSCDVIQLLKFILTPGAFQPSSGLNIY